MVSCTPSKAPGGFAAIGSFLATSVFAFGS